jgi:outer membrane protein TolC
MRSFWLTGFFIVAFHLLSSAQEQTTVFTQNQFVWYVRNHHPVAVQAALLLDQGESTVRSARGGFDPELQAGVDQKYFDDKTYYSLIGAGLKVPTWYGIELEAGYDQNRGDFLNPQRTLPEGGLWYAGISVPIGKGLVIDERRAVLRQAQIFAQSTQADQERIMNNLFFEAIKTYWKWAEAWSQYQIFEESLELAITRYNAVKKSFELGDLPAIDTLEAFIQVQNREMNRNEFQLFYQNLSLELSNYLWLENNTPLFITEELRPPAIIQAFGVDIIAIDSLQNLLADLAEMHPEMKLYGYKLATMEVDKRLKKEELKPTVNLEYNTLFGTTPDDALVNTFPGNYTWGLEFNFPLFLRKERGNVQLAKLKIQDTELGQRQKLLELQNKVRSYYNEQVNLVGQVELYSDAVNNYERLLRGEQQKFNTGESSLFLINSREVSLIQAQLKLIGLLTKFNIADNGLIWASGTLHLQ